MSTKQDRINHEVMQELTDIKVAIASLPEVLANKFDERYAVKKTETDLDTLTKKLEARQYDWLKYSIATAIMFVITIYLQR